MQTPADADGKRIDIMPLTDIDSVVYNDEKTLHEYLDELDENVSDNTTRLDNSGQVILSTMEPTEAGFFLFAEINKPSADDVDYKYDKYSTLSDELIKRLGAKKIVANGEEDFDPVTMIKLGDLAAYDPDEEWEVGTYVAKSIKE